MSTKLVAEILETHGATERGEPGADERLKQLQHQYRTSGSIVRNGGGAAIVEHDATASPGPRRVTRSSDLPYGHSYRDVELREHFVRCTVDLTPQVREGIFAEIKRVHRDRGEEVEVGGWLFSPYLARATSDSIEVVRSTWPAKALLRRGQRSTWAIRSRRSGRCRRRASAT